MERLMNMGAIAIFLLLVCLVIFIVAFEPTTSALSQISQAPALQGKEEQVPSNPEPVSLTPGDREWVERVVMSEARGEPWEGQVAVAQVIRDRVRHPSFPKTVMGVLTECNQFAEPYERPVSEDVKEAVRYAFDLECSVFPGQLLYFMNPQKARPKSAQWIRDNALLRVTIGNHEFYGERGV